MDAIHHYKATIKKGKKKGNHGIFERNPAMFEGNPGMFERV